MAVLRDVVEARARQAGDAAIELQTDVLGHTIAHGSLTAEAEVPLARKLLFIACGKMLGACRHSRHLWRQRDGPFAGGLSDK